MIAVIVIFVIAVIVIFVIAVIVIFVIFGQGGFTWLGKESLHAFFLFLFFFATNFLFVEVRQPNTDLVENTHWHRQQ